MNKEWGKRIQATAEAGQDAVGQTLMSAFGSALGSVAQGASTLSSAAPSANQTFLDNTQPDFKEMSIGENLKGADDLSSWWKANDFTKGAW